MDDNSTYNAITDRISINDLDNYLVTSKSALQGVDYYKDGY